MLTDLIKNIFARPLRFFGKHPYFSSLAIVLAIIIAVVSGVFKNGADNANAVITVSRESISQEVSLTGKTKPAQSVDLAFERSGKTNRVSAKVGDKVKTGQVLASLDSSELYAQLMQAQADLQTQKIKLKELENGTRPEEITLYETQLENARTAWSDARLSSSEKTKNAYSQADNAVRNQADLFFSNSRSQTPTVTITVYDPQLKTNLENGRLAVESDLVRWQTEIDNLTSAADPVFSLTQAADHLGQIRSFLDKLALAINSLSNDGYKTTVSSARTNISAALTDIVAAKEKLNTAESNYLVAKRNLELKQSGNQPETVSAQEAQVQRAEAGISLIQAQIAKTVLRSPIAGIVTKMDIETGEIAPAGSAVATVMAESALEIEANVPEVDIVKVNPGDTVTIMLDAMPNKTFSGQVTYIDPAETIIDGVVNFKIKIIFDEINERVKSGLTANLDIETMTKKDALVLPQFAVIENDRGTFVKKIPPAATGLASVKNINAAQEVPVKTGLRSQDGRVEIISGLAEGDLVLNIGLKPGN